MTMTIPTMTIDRLTPDGIYALADRMENTENGEQFLTTLTVNMTSMVFQ
jgi:hypothetical protein